MINELYATNMPYYLVLGEHFLYGKAALASIQATLYRKPKLDDAFLKVAVENEKSILWLKYDTLEENTRCESRLDKIGDSDSWIVSYNLYGNELENGIKILSPEKAAEMLPEIVARNETLMVEQGIVNADCEDHCGNCHKTISIGDRYCRFCGTKRGEDKFQPENNQFYCVYGPPILTKFKCSDCGLSWEITVLGGCRETYCPNCGKKVHALAEIEKSFFEFN